MNNSTFETEELEIKIMKAELEIKKQTAILLKAQTRRENANAEILERDY